MEKYKFAYVVEVTVELPTDDKELVRQVENENGVKVTYKNLEAELTDMIAEHMEYFDSHFDINVQPVKHGHWRGYTISAFHGCDDFGTPIYRDVNVWHCSRCNRKTVIKENYCPNCGARMGGDLMGGDDD